MTVTPNLLGLRVSTEDADRVFSLGSSRQERSLDTPSLPTSHLSTGCRSLDCALVVHLRKCSSQLLVPNLYRFLFLFSHNVFSVVVVILETFCLQRLGTAGPLRCGEMFALDTLSRELGVFRRIRNLTEHNPKSQRHVSEGKNFH